MIALPLVAPKPFADFGAQEFYEYVQGMYELRVKRGGKPKSPVEGLSVNRTKTGALSVRRTKARPFAYVTLAEIATLAKAAKCSQADLWNTFKAREFIIAPDRMSAEKVHMALQEIPF